MKYLFFILSLFFLPELSYAAPPSSAVKFVILKPNNSTVGTPITVTVEAEKSNNQADINYQNDVTLVTSGSATGGGVVDIVNGAGILEINDLVAETVTLSLSDTESTGLSVSSTRQVTFTSGGGGGGPAATWHQQKFWFRDDDGDEISATDYGSENVGVDTNITNVVQGTIFRLRVGMKLSAADSSISPRLEFKEGTDCATGNWTAVTSTSATVNLLTSPNFDDGAPTTQQLVGGQNFVAGKILESTNPAGSLSLLKNQSTEYEWSLGVVRNAPYNTTYSFRITNNGTALDVYGVCPILTTQPAPMVPPPSGSGGDRGGGFKPTTITFSGRAFPDAKIVVIDKDARVEHAVSQNVVTNADGTFQIDFVGILQSQHSFGLHIKDKENRATQTKFFNIDTLANGLVVKDIVVPPTIGLLRHSVTRGHTAIITGYASPESSIILEIDATIKKELTTEKDGSYKTEIETGNLEFGSHRIRAKQMITDKKKESDFSPVKTFVVSRLMSPKIDLSGDGRIDIKDWSMFLSQWFSKDTGERKSIDFNEDGKIDISDFSIFIKTIRKK